MTPPKVVTENADEEMLFEAAITRTKSATRQTLISVPLPRPASWIVTYPLPRRTTK